MNDLIRPALYEGYHEIVPLRERVLTPNCSMMDVVGPVCESGDFFAQDREVAPLEQGDRIALMSARRLRFRHVVHLQFPAAIAGEFLSRG